MHAGVYRERRQKLLNLLPVGSKVVVYGRNRLTRHLGVPLDFHQFSDLLYLSGEDRPGATLVIDKQKNKIHSTLFLPVPDKEKELWEGFMTDFSTGQKRSGVDEVLPSDTLDTWIEKNASNSQTVYCSFPPHQNCHKPFRQLKPYIDQIRVIKTPQELDLIKKACKITQESMSALLKDLHSGMSEREVAMRFELEAWERGATGFAYPVECQSGRNALCLHYTEGKDRLKEGDCLLIDAGCEYQHYASDFTRTVAIGKTNQAKLAALAMVDEMRKSLVKMAKSGAVESLQKLNEECKQMSLKCLRELGVKADMNTLSKYCPHSVSHWIGLDVHDCTSVPLDTKLKRGHVFSVEPGMYFGDDVECPSELRGTGIRSEDTVLLGL